MKHRITLLATLAVCATMTLGCSSYYKVSDPGTGKVYYTKDIKKRSGSIEFKDASTGNKVTIQNSEVSKIKKKEFDTARKSGM